MAKILIVDDEENLIHSVVRELSRTGFEVAIANDGVEACKMIEEEIYDVVISDMKMPRMSGMQLLEYVSQRSPTTEFIILTGYGSMENVLAAFKTGRVFEYLLKPLDDIHELSSTVARAVDRRLLSMENAALINERQELALIVENSADFIAMATAEGQLTYINTAGCMLVGLHEGAGTPASRLIDYFAPEDQLEMNHIISRILSSDGQWHGEMHLRHFGMDETILVNANLFTIKALQGSKQIGIAIVARDIRHSRAMERQLAQSQRLESIGQLAAGIAHEINTPVQYIGDNTRFLKDMYEELKWLLGVARELAVATDEEERQRAISSLIKFVEPADLEYAMSEIPISITQTLEGVERVAHIVRAMKDFSHPGSEEKTVVDLNRALDSTITVARHEWKYVAEVVQDFDPNLPLVPCFPSDLNQMFLNIIVNAAHAIGDTIAEGSMEKGTITVSSRFRDDHVEIRITDTGTGIPASAQKKIFDPFFTTKAVGKGTGQGLSISHQVAQRHGGSIAFETQLGIGTTFIIRLPLECADASVPTQLAA